VLVHAHALKEQCIYLHHFPSLEEAQRLIGEFIGRYNREWGLGSCATALPSSSPDWSRSLWS